MMFDVLSQSVLFMYVKNEAKNVLGTSAVRFLCLICVLTVMHLRRNLVTELRGLDGKYLLLTMKNVKIVLLLTQGRTF